MAGLRNYAAEHVVLIGKPGSGKSTSLERLLGEEAEKALHDPNARIPVLVKLRRCSGTIEGLIRDFLVGHKGDLLEIAQIEELLRQGRFLLLLDGLNELPEPFRTEVANFRDRYRRTTPMIVSTRDLGGGGTLGIEKTLKMLPLTEPQMREFVRGYLGEEGDRLFQQLKGDRLRKFAETPLLLWMLCRVFYHNGKVPDNLGLAFREFTQLHDQELQADAPADSKDQWPKLLRHLAFVMMQGKTSIDPLLSIPREEAEDCLTAYLQKADRSNPREYAERWLKDLLKYHLIQPVIQPNLEKHIEFRHQLIQEYYAAECLLRRLPNLTDEQLKRNYLNYLKWTEPVALMLAMVDGEAQALRVVKLAMDEVDLMLGARFAGEVKPTLQDTTVGWIDAKPLPIRLKVQCWGTSRSEKAVAVLLTTLQDSDYIVFQSAADALGKIGSEKAMARLLTALQDSDYRVRRYAAEALGNIGSEKAMAGLLTALQDSDADVRRYAAEALGKIGSEQAVEGLLTIFQNSYDKVLQHSYDIVRRYAAEALGRIGSEKAMAGLLTALQDSDADVRWSAANALGRIGSEKAVEGLLIALQDSDAGVCEEAAYALGKIGNARSLANLWQLYHQDGENIDWNDDISAAISAIQNRCQFYNYEIFQAHLAAQKGDRPASQTSDPNAITIQTLESLTIMTDKAPIFNQQHATIGVNYAAEGSNIEFTQHTSSSEQTFEILLTDYQQFIEQLQQKYPTVADPTTVPQIIEVKAKLIEAQDQQRWQNFLNLKRLWNGSKQAGVKVGEHFAENNVWAKGAIAFLEGISEDGK